MGGKEEYDERGNGEVMQRKVKTVTGRILGTL
jgi:hypothetical protein